MNQPLYRTVYRTERFISNEEFLDAKIIYKELLTANDYKVRVERWNGFCIYSNDKKFLLNLAKKLNNSVREFWEPNQKNINYLLISKNILIVDTPPLFPFKITFNYKKINPSFANWLEKNTDKSNVGEKAMYNISRGWASGNYIFVRDEKVLTMIKLIVGHNIQKVERLVYSGDIDK